MARVFLLPFLFSFVCFLAIKCFQKWHHPPWCFHTNNSIILFSFFFHINCYDSKLKSVLTITVFYFILDYKTIRHSFMPLIVTLILNPFSCFFASNCSVTTCCHNLLHYPSSNISNCINTVD